MLAHPNNKPDDPECPNCHGSISVRNPSGWCDHLYWPRMLTPEAKIKVREAQGEDCLDDDDLETILIVARNGQSGRITEREIKLLVAAYLKLNN